MTDRQAERAGTVDAQITRDLMDLRLFDDYGSFVSAVGAVLVRDGHALLGFVSLGPPAD